MNCVFTNDGGITVSLIEHPFTQTFANRNYHEVLFRQMHAYLINTGIIENNIIDLGAWIGDNTIPWAKSIGAKSIGANAKSIGANAKSIDTIGSKIYSIDPSEDNCQFIRQMCEHNQIDNVKVFQTAISDKNELLSTNDDMFHCTFTSDDQGRNKVNAITLDYLFEKGEIENIGYIHLDVEGMEYKIILGSDKIIDSCRPVITFEQHLEIDNYNEILDHLTNRKYVVFLIDEILPGCRSDCRNSIAFPKEIFDQSIVTGIHEYVGKEILLPL